MSTKRSAACAQAHKWEFKARFRRNAFGWKSQPAITRVKQAVGEIKKVAKKEPLLAAEGAVVFLERVSPALEHVDSSSGAIGTAVNNAIAELVPIIVSILTTYGPFREIFLRSIPPWGRTQALEVAEIHLTGGSSV